MTTTHKVVLRNVNGKLFFEIPDDIHSAVDWKEGTPMFLYQFDEQSFWLSTNDESDVLSEIERLLGEVSKLAKEAHRAIGDK